MGAPPPPPWPGALTTHDAIDMRICHTKSSEASDVASEDCRSSFGRMAWHGAAAPAQYVCVCVNALCVRMESWAHGLLADLCTGEDPSIR